MLLKCFFEFDPAFGLKQISRFIFSPSFLFVIFDMIFFFIDYHFYYSFTLNFKCFSSLLDYFQFLSFFTNEYNEYTTYNLSAIPQLINPMAFQYSTSCVPIFSFDYVMTNFCYLFLLLQTIYQPQSIYSISSSFINGGDILLKLKLGIMNLI